MNSELNLQPGIEDHLNEIVSAPVNLANPANIAPPVVEDSLDDVLTVIRKLATPPDNIPINVSKQYNNDSIEGDEVQAYAKIAGCNWTYYVKSLAITIGRNTEVHSSNSNSNYEIIDIDLGPSKVVSRKHASIKFNLMTRKWQLFIIGRNGLKVNGFRQNPSTEPFDLSSGNIIDIGGTQMMFILPDSPPIIHPNFRHLMFNKRAKVEDYPRANSTTNINEAQYSRPDTQVNAFQLHEGGSNHSESTTEQDYSKDDAKDLKPPYSYATMITQAILSNPQGILSLSEIYDWISSHFAFYRHTKQGWQNSIRHNLSLNRAFEKVPRKPNEPGKGMKWQISEEYRNEFLKKWQDGSLNKVRRGTSVSRQLQLHLIKNNALPSGRSSSTGYDENSSVTAPPKIVNTAANTNVPPQLTFYANKGYTSPNTLPIPQQQIAISDSNMIKMESPIKGNSGNKNVHNNIPSPLKGVNISDLSYLNNQQTKLSSGLMSNSDLMGIPSSSNPKPIINDLPPGVGSVSIKSAERIGRSDYDISAASKSQVTGHPPLSTNDVSNGTTHIGNNHNIINSHTSDIISPKKNYNRLDPITPERNFQRPNLEPNSIQSHGIGSTNSSPALWNYVQFSTPLGPNSNTHGNMIGTTNTDQEKLPLESPLKNRLDPHKNADLVKQYKQ